MSRLRHLSTAFSVGILILLCLSLVFIYQDRLLVTPDFGQSDAYHYNLSAKFFLAENLKQNRFPFWTDKLQGGYPFIAESQSGAFYLPDLILLRFLPFPLAYNLLFVVSFIFLSVGFFLVLREFEVRPFIAFILSLSFLANGAYLFRLTHLNLIMSFSLFPFLFLCYLKMKKGGGVVSFIAFPFIISQMIFAGHNQAVFVGLVGLMLYHLTLKKTFWSTIHLVGLIAVGYLFALPQIVPTMTLSGYAARLLALDFNTATLFPFNFTNLVNFLSAYAFGSPKNGTYPLYNDNWGIFWENTPYIGFLLSVIVYTLFLGYLLVTKHRTRTVVYGLLFVFFLLILLVLGKNSPLYFLFNFPPFNFYRVPSKFLLPAVFFLFILVAYLFDFWMKRSRTLLLVLSVVLLINLFDLVAVTGTYHLFLPVSRVLAFPQIVASLSEKSYLTIDPTGSWNKIFLTKGWSDKQSAEGYLRLKETLYPDSNLLFGKSSYAINSPGFQLKRNSFLHTYILSSAAVQNKTIHFGPHVSGLMRLLDISDVITTYPIANTDFELKKKVSGDPQIYLYRIRKQSGGLYYIPKKTVRIQYLKDFTDMVERQTDLEDIAAVEDSLPNTRNKVNVAVLEQKEDSYKLKVDAVGETLLVMRKNNYPDWKAYVDGQEVKTYRVNLVHTGVIVPNGTHVLTYVFTNESFKKGLVGAIIIASCYICFLWWRSKRFKRLAL